MVPTELGLIAGKGVYPLLLAESARRQGVRRIFAVAFRGETDRSIARLVDEVAWIHLGQLERMLDALRVSGVRHAVMAGQVTPTRIFSVRLDAAMIDLLRRLPVKNAETVFGAVGERLRERGIELQPAYLFMEAHMPAAGLLAQRAITERERIDIDLGVCVAKQTSGIDIGQTVVIKDGIILAVEALEGTNKTIRRAGKLGGAGAVVVKVAKEGHDMRFDIPVVGVRTIEVLRRARAAVLALEAGRTILLERERMVRLADRWGIGMVAVTEPARARAGGEGGGVA